MKKFLSFMLFATVAVSTCFAQETKISTKKAGHTSKIPDPGSKQSFTAFSADGTQKVQFFLEKAESESDSVKTIFTDWVFYKKAASGEFKPAPLVDAKVSIRGDRGVIRARDLIVGKEAIGYFCIIVDISKTNRLTFRVTYDNSTEPAMSKDFSLKIAGKDISDFAPYPNSTNTLAVASIKH